MERRKFLSLLGMTAAGLALDQAIPFNRVWSFPKEIVIAPNGLHVAHWFRVGDEISIAGFPGAYRITGFSKSGDIDLIEMRSPDAWRSMGIVTANAQKYLTLAARQDSHP